MAVLAEVIPNPAGAAVAVASLPEVLVAAFGAEGGSTKALRAAGLGRQAHQVPTIHFKGPLPSFRV